MPADAVRLFAKLMLAAAEAAREARPSEWEAPPGSIVYRPQKTEGIHSVALGNIRDDKTGCTLSRPFETTAESEYADLPGDIILWELKRDQETTIYFVTLHVHQTGKITAPIEPPVMIIHASEDGFFPFEDALYTEDFSFERVTAMLDLRISKRRGPKPRVYFDSRDAYRERNRVMAKRRAERQLRVANFDPDPNDNQNWQVYHPVLDGFSYDPETGTSAAPDGSTLQWIEGRWKIGRNYSGERYGVAAKWTAPDGERRQFVTIVPHRAWRDGHGETRCAQLIYSDQPKYLNNAATPLVPDGETLAGLVNANGNIAGEHRGQMIIIDSRPHGHNWRVTTSESWW